MAIQDLQKFKHVLTKDNYFRDRCEHGWGGNVCKMGLLSLRTSARATQNK